MNWGHEATALAERMGGAAPVAMICLDPQAPKQPTKHAEV